MSDRLYTTEANIENYLSADITTGEANMYILAAQEYIERMTGRVFRADAEASTRLFDGNNKQYLLIDDCVDVTKVEVSDDAFGDEFTEISESGIDRYYTMPTNEKPINKIGLRSRIFCVGHANHRITAKWGFSADVPGDIVFAATVIAAGMYFHNKGAKTGAITREKVGQYEVAYANATGFDDIRTAESILESYRKYFL